MKATAEGRLYNHSPRLASLPGVSCERINLPPKSGCINHGKYFSKLSQRPAIGSGVPPAREMGRMRSAYRVTEKCRRSATMPMWRWHFYNRTSAVVAHASVSRGRRTNPVLAYETALRRFLGDAPRRWRIPMENGFINGDGNSKMEATAEGRLYNHSPRLACLPGVSCGRRIYRRKAVVEITENNFSKLSQPSRHR